MGARLWNVSTMCVLLLCVMGLTIFSCGFIARPHIPSKGDLICAHIIFRHGDRNPIDTYPSDPHRKNHSHWPEGLKQLTNIGKRQQFELGQFFGRRYKDLLGSARYASDLVYVQSTDDDRTQMSALCNLAGLFPPIESQIWNEDLLWQPIPVHSMPDLMDHLLSTNRPCPRYSYEKKKLKQSNKIRKLRKRLKPFLEFLTEKSGRKITSLFHVRKLYNTLYVEELKNLPLPEWTRSVYPDGEMKWIAEFSLKLPTYTPPMARLKSGFLLSDILNHSLKKSRGCKKLPQKLWMYSSHDTTIANMLNTLGSFELHHPPYCSCLMFEVRKLKNDYVLQIFYRNTTTETPKALNIPNCGCMCPLSKMFELYDDVLPDGDFETECRLPKHDDSDHDRKAHGKSKKKQTHKK